jgi:flagellar biosynthesis activator protein FlaF
VYQNALQAYQSVEKTTLPGRELEAMILTRAAQKLRHCQENWDKEDRTEALDEALKYNQRIWSIFQTELASPDNPMPIHLKRDLLRLSGFIDKRIFETIARPSPEKLTIIININQNIAAGLRN